MSRQEINVEEIYVEEGSTGNSCRGNEWEGVTSPWQRADLKKMCLGIPEPLLSTAPCDKHGFT